MTKNPGENYSGISNPGWGASTINEMEGFRFPELLLAAHGSPAQLKCLLWGTKGLSAFVFREVLLLLNSPY